MQSFNTDFDSGPTVVPPYCTVPFGLSIAIYTTTCGLSAGRKPINDSM